MPSPPLRSAPLALEEARLLAQEDPSRLPLRQRRRPPPRVLVVVVPREELLRPAQGTRREDGPSDARDQARRDLFPVDSVLGAVAAEEPRRGRRAAAAGPRRDGEREGAQRGPAWLRRRRWGDELAAGTGERPAEKSAANGDTRVKRKVLFEIEHLWNFNDKK